MSLFIDVFPCCFAEIIDELKFYLDSDTCRSFTAGEEVIFCEWVQPDWKHEDIFDRSTGYYTGLRFHSVIRAAIIKDDVATIYLFTPGTSN